MSKENEISNLIEAKAYKRIRKELVKDCFDRYTSFDDFLGRFDLNQFVNENSCLESYLIGLFHPDTNDDISKRDVMRCLLEDMSFSEVRALEGLVSHDELYDTFLKEFQKRKFDELKKRCSLIVKLNESMQKHWKKSQERLEAA